MRPPLPDPEVVADHIREVSAELIEPRWRTLAEGEVDEKRPGDLVTVADLEAEAALTRIFERLTPGALVVGEEATTTDPRLVDGLAAAPLAWTIDPVDGTANFVAGSPDFGTMVAATSNGETVMAWILLPARGVMLIAERGAGATSNGADLRPAAATGSTPVDGPDQLVAVLKTKYLDAKTRAHVLARADGLGGWSVGTGCAATEYHDLVAGPTDAIFWGQTHPWDHAPGCLIVTEAGGVAARWNGEAYRPAPPGFGLTVARDPSRWETLQAELGPPRP